MAKVLSIKQPYAQLAVMGSKRIETRPMRTNYRGVLYIHASQDFHKGLMRLVSAYPFREYIKKMAHELTTGAIIGRVQLVGCVLIDDNFKATVSEHERAFGDYTNGRFAWLIEDAQLFNKPIPAKGQLGIWNFTLPETPLV
jgi:activating signal cointegrator 1